MVRMFKLDKVIAEGVTYETGADEFLVIKKIGTDSTAGARLVIDGYNLGQINATLAPMHKTSTNAYGLLDLGDLYYVVPPNKKYWLSGGGTDKMRIVGFIGRLGRGETMPPQYEARFRQQIAEYLTFVEGSLSLGTDVAFTAGSEQEVYTLIPNSKEQYIFDNVLYCAVSGRAAGIDWGTFALRFYKQGEPLDVLVSSEAPLGIDLKAIPSPPTTTDYEEAFTLADYPIAVAGDESFSVKVVNISGADKAPDNGSAWSFDFKAIVRYKKL